MREVALTNQRLQKILLSISKNVYEEETLSNLVKRQVHLEDDLITDLHPKDD